LITREPKNKSVILSETPVRLAPKDLAVEASVTLGKIA